MARVKVCPTCGRENALVDIRCVQCRVSLADVSLTEAAPPASEPVVATHVESATISCPHCDAAIFPDSALCPYCGESLRTGPRITVEGLGGRRFLKGN